MFQRVISKSVPRVGRRFASTTNPFPPADAAKAKLFKEHLVHLEEHSKQTTDLWKKISYFVAFPSIAITGYFILNVELEHAKHREHLLHVPDEEWPVAYSYQNVRKKPYFWGDGDKTLFWNPIINRHITE